MIRGERGGNGGRVGRGGNGGVLEVVEFDAEGFAAVKVVEEGGVGLGGFGGVFLREVDEVGAVGEDVAAGVSLETGRGMGWDGGDLERTLWRRSCVRGRMRGIGPGASLGGGGSPTCVAI